MPEILDLERQFMNAEWDMKLGKGAETAFPRLGQSGASGHYVGPATALKHTLNWIWLSLVSGESLATLSATVQPILTRATAVYDLAAGDTYRERHDFLLLACVLFAGSREVSQKVLDLVRTAIPGRKENQYYAASCGMVKFRLLGDDESARQQFAIFCTHKGKEAVFRNASQNFYRAFIELNLKVLQNQTHKVAEEFWKRLEAVRLPRLVNKDGEIELKDWDYNRYWPWPEAAMLRVLRQRGLNIKPDGFWIPEELMASNLMA